MWENGKLIIHRDAEIENELSNYLDRREIRYE